jgi:uncharacterized 2Fe-2S/4Fe-4S cluster protein (DUF4445 family)
MEHTISVNDRGTITKMKAPDGAVLLDTLRHFGKGISAPCNGRGKCRKCSVEVVGTGQVLSCDYKIKSDIEVVLPRTSKAQILSDRSVAHSKDENDAGLLFIKTDGVLKYKNLSLGQHSENTLYGVAIDIGTTTVVAYLVDLATYTVVDVVSFINPQTHYGHDVITRIQHVMTNKNGLKELRGVLTSMINEGIVTACTRNGINGMAIYKMTIVGNPTMLHLFCGIDPSSIAAAPYTPAFTDKKTLRGKEMGLAMNPEGVVLIMPSVSGYVGADITAGVATTPMTHSGETSLFIDIGTNGEMALSKGPDLFCCATAAGPAFEGALIECGVGGIEGAISSYDGERYVTIGNAAPVGICGSGLIDIVAVLLQKGIIDITGYMAESYLLEMAAKTASHFDIVLTPQDVRQVQLAKAAIAAGFRVLMSEAGVSFDQIENLYIGGAFGNYMNIESASVIGLIPPEMKEKVVTTGNVAGRGALSALMSVKFEDRIAEVAQKAQYIELSTHGGFMDHYVMQMGFEGVTPGTVTVSL